MTIYLLLAPTLIWIGSRLPLMNKFLKTPGVIVKKTNTHQSVDNESDITIEFYRFKERLIIQYLLRLLFPEGRKFLNSKISKVANGPIQETFNRQLLKSSNPPQLPSKWSRKYSQKIFERSITDPRLFARICFSEITTRTKKGDPQDCKLQF